MVLALRDVIQSRPVRAVRALLLRAADARAALVARGKSDVSAKPSRAEKVRGLDDTVTIARDAFGVPGIFGTTLADVAFGMGWACAEDRLFQIELFRRAMRGELAATFGDREADPKRSGRLFAGRTYVDLDAFSRALGLRGAAEASYAVCSTEGRAWLDAYARGINAYLASGRRPLEMLLLDLEPTPWTGADPILISRGIAFQLSFSHRFALAHALVRDAVGGEGDARAEALRPIVHPFTATRGGALGDDGLAPLVATLEVLRAVLGTSGVHLGSNAFAVGPSRAENGRPLVASDPHMPLMAPSIFWEARVKGGGLDARGVAIPGVPAIAIGQNAHGAWGVTAGWGDDAQLYRVDLARLRAEGRLQTRRESIAVRDGDDRHVSLHESPRGPLITPFAEGPPARGESAAHEHGIAIRWSGREASPDGDAALALMRAHTFDELREALRLHTAPTLNFVWADDGGHIGWQYAGRIPVRRGNEDGAVVVSGLDIVDDTNGDDARGDLVGFVPFDALPFVRDPKDGVIVSANVCPVPTSYPHFLGELFEPPFRMARIRALLDAYAHFGKIGLTEIAAIQRDARSAWATQLRDALFSGLDDDALVLPTRRGRDVVRLARAWDGHAGHESVGATATYALFDAVMRHVFLEALGEEAFERYFELLNASALPMLGIFGDGDDPGAWLAGRDRAALVRDAAAMAEGVLRRRLGDDPLSWRWGTLHTMTFDNALASAADGTLLGPGVRAIASPGPFPASGDGTTVSMGEFEIGGDFQVRVAPAMRTVMIAGVPSGGRIVLPPGQSGDPATRHYRDQASLYVAGELRAASWDETDFHDKRVRLVRES